MNKRLITPFAAVLVVGLVVGGATWGRTLATEKPPIVQEVEHQGEVLDNHEDRITNNEADIEDLQSTTNTPPSPGRTVVREVITPSPTQPIYTEPTPEPEPEPVIVVTAFRQIPVNEGYNNENVDCELTYSDNTTYRWHWKTVTYNQTKITNTSGTCDAQVIGAKK